MNTQFESIALLLKNYFDGLYFSDTKRLSQVFHPNAIYVCVTDGNLLQLSMQQYFPMVAQRESPASRKDLRDDRIVSIEFAGPVTAMAKVNCCIGERYFTDLLSLIFIEQRWQIISKVFHYDLLLKP